MSDEAWLIMKRDLFYMPNGHGYTGIRDHAGRYTYEDATRLASPESGESIIKLSEAPEFSKACFDDLARKHLAKQRDELLAALAAKTADFEELRSTMASPETWISQWLAIEMLRKALRPFAEAFFERAAGGPGMPSIAAFAIAAELVPPEGG